MENKLSANRVQSLDLLKGIILLLMALDHTRDFFHSSAFLFNPLDPQQSNWPLYLTRWITHFCAPAFSLLASVSAFFVGGKKSATELSVFLFKRGLWLVFIQQTLIQFAWYFSPHFNWIELDVIASLGVSMIVLGLLVHTPRSFILAFSLLLIFGHNLLDSLDTSESVWWGILHKWTVVPINSYFTFGVYYPLIPWVGVMALGYWLGGQFYTKSFDPQKRKKALTYLGVGAIGLFIVLRGFNLYGNPTEWIASDYLSQSLMAMLDVSKYPPSLAYLLATLGPAFLFMAYSEQAKGKVVELIMMFGRVPFLYYIVHLFIIHGLAMLATEFTWTGWEVMVLSEWVTDTAALDGYGFSLGVVYLIWAMVVALMYPICKAFDRYKQAHKEKSWLSYL